MNLIPPLHNELVSIIFQPHQLTLFHIQSSHKTAPFTLRAYEQIPLHDLELEKLHIHNPTQLKRIITNFLTKYSLNHTFVLFALSGPGVFERYIPLATAHASNKDFCMPELQQLHWEYEYLYPADYAQSIYYVCGITPQTLLQYQLLAISAQLNLLKITTKRMALHTIYKYMYGHAFRKTQFAVDMLQHNNMIEYIFSQDTLNRIVHIPGHITIDKKLEMTNILSACGLITSERTL